MPRPSTERGEASRERILACALALFAEKGVSATSVAEVCREAGVAKTGLYWHFDSKEGLLAAVLERAASAQAEQIQKAVYQEGDPLSRLDAFVGHLRSLLEHDSEVLRLHLAVALERGNRDKVTRAALRRVSRTLKATIAQGIEDAVGRTVPNADLLAHTILALLDGALLSLVIDPEGTDLDRLQEHMRTTFVLLGQHYLEAGGVRLADILGEVP